MIDILIADDNAVLTEQLSNVLSNEKDFNILKISKNGMEAFNDYLCLKPTVFILDLKMPKMSGLEVIEKLSDDKYFDSKRNIIVVSAITSLRSQISNTKKIEWVFQKPFDFNKLIHIIRNIYKETTFKKNIEHDLNYLLNDLSIKPYLKGAKYLKKAIEFVYYDPEREINIASLTKQVAIKFKVFRPDSVHSAIDKTINTMTLLKTSDPHIKTLFTSYYKITTKDFIDRAIHFIDDN